jgi:membrane protein implicated in regulation of membrane protease activity
MATWGSYSYLFGPVVAFCLVAVLALLLRWTFGRGRSVVERPSRRGRAADYGLLVAVAEPATFVEAEMIRRSLDDVGIRATLAPTTEGPRVMVFEGDAVAARAHLAKPT